MNNRIDVNPNICHGQPCIKGTRIMVYLIIELLEAGLTPSDIITDYYPQITMEDIKACLHYTSGHRRELLAQSIIKTNQEFTKGKVKRGNVEDLMKELVN